MNELQLIAATERRLNQTIETLSEVRAELATKNAAIATQAAEIERLRAAVTHAEAVLRKASKEETQNGWIETAPQYFEWLADVLRDALNARALAGQDGG